MRVEKIKLGDKKIAYSITTTIHHYTKHQGIVSFKHSFLIPANCISELQQLSRMKIDNKELTKLIDEKKITKGKIIKYIATILFKYGVAVNKYTIKTAFRKTFHADISDDTIRTALKNCRTYTNRKITNYSLI